MTRRQGRRNLSKISFSRPLFSCKISFFVVGLILLQCAALAVFLWRQIPDKEPRYDTDNVTKQSTSHIYKLRAREDKAESHQRLRSDDHLPENIRLARLEATIQEELSTNSSTSSRIESCRWFQRHHHDSSGTNRTGITTFFSPDCQQASDELLVYNPGDTDRFWCDGQVLKAKSTTRIQITPDCQPIQQPSHLYPTTPSLQSAANLPPVRISTNPNDDPNTFYRKHHPCDVPCEYKDRSTIAGYVYIQQTPWKFTFSMEGSGYYHYLKIDENEHLNNHFYATTSFHSEVPLPYYSWAEYNIQTTTPVDYDTVIHGASFIAKNCGSLNKRDDIVKKLQSYIRVDALSRCLHNADPPNNLSLRNKTLLQQQYLFHLAFENSCEHDYVTEKMWGTLESGTLPIYFGAPNILEHVPENSIISVHDFQSIDALGEYLQRVISNKTLYEQYHDWRKHPLPDRFVHKYNFTHIHSTCRMCRWSFARKYGLGWDHETQTVQDAVVGGRRVTINTDGLVAEPFQESWSVIPDGGPVTVSSVQDRSWTVQVGPWLRTVFEHDGVVDVHLERVLIAPSEGAGYRYRIETNLLQGEIMQREPDKIMWQNETHRLTILTSWNSFFVAESVSDGAVEVLLVSNDTPALARIRLIMEDVDTFHTTGSDRTYYFAQTMEDDFKLPVEVFLEARA